MLISSMSVSVDGLLIDRDGAFGWTTVVVGGGTPFLPPANDPVAPDLVEARTFGSRVIFERSRR